MKNIIIAIMGIAAVMGWGLTLHEQGRANYYAEKAASYAVQVRDLTERDVELARCMNDAAYGDYCTVQYAPSGEVIDVILEKEVENDN